RTDHHWMHAISRIRCPGHHPRRSPRPRTMAAPMTELSVSPTSTPVDARGRPLRDLRISVTDRCNFRCVYCMPRDTFGPDHAFLPRAEILTFEEITRLAGVFTSLGVSNVRLTGREPP